MTSPIPSTGYNMPMKGSVFQLAIPVLNDQPVLSINNGTTRIHGAYTSPYTEKWGLDANRLPLTLQAIGFKKKIVQTICSAGTSNVLSQSSFWVDVYRELDPINYHAYKEKKNDSLIMHANSGRGTSLSTTFANSSSLEKGILWITKSVNTSGSPTSFLWLSDKVAVGDTELGSTGNGYLISSDGQYGYYWKDDSSSPVVVSGSAKSLEPAVAIVGGKEVSTYAIDPLLIYDKNKSIPYTLYSSELPIMGPNKKSVTRGNLVADGSSQYWSGFYIRFAGKDTPISVEKTDNERMQTWMAASSFPSPPEGPIAYSPFAVSDTNRNNYYAIAKLANGFYKDNGSTYKIDARAGLMTSGNASHFAYLQGKYIVLPGVFTTSSVSAPSSHPGSVITKSNFTDQTFDQAISIFNGNQTGVSFGPGQHLGIFEDSAKATAWATYVNGIIDIYAKARVASVSGNIYLYDSVNIAQNIQFNPIGLRGIPDSSWQPFSSSTGSQQQTTTIGGSNPPEPDVAQDPLTYDPFGLGPGVRLTIANATALLWDEKQTGAFAKNVLITLTKDLGQSWDLTKQQLILSINKARVADLVAKGTPLPEAKKRVDEIMKNALITTMAKPVASGTNSGTNGNGNTQLPADSKSNQKATQKITITRGLIGYMPPPAGRSTRPQLVQQYRYTDTVYSADGRQSVSKQVEIDPLIYEFPFTPREVQYSGLGSTWTEVARAGNFPIVDWQSYQLLKISFNFDVVDTTISRGSEGFGMDYPVDEQLNVLRKMALAPYPVSFLNMDEIMSKELRYPLFTKGRGVEFVINDFSITSIQRTDESKNLGSKISRATCSITLQEIPIENANIVYMRPITPCTKKSCPPPRICAKVPCTNNTSNLLLSTLVIEGK